jgi:hypothetical protein
LSDAGDLTVIEANEIKKIVFEDGITFENHFINVPVIDENYMYRTQAQYKEKSNYFKGYTLVEKLVTGTISLYQYVDRFHYSHFFYQTSTDSEIVLLTYQTYVEDAEFKYDNSYKSLLLFLARVNECNSSVDSKIEQLKYEVNPIINIIRELNACSGQSIQLNNTEYTNHTEIRFGLMGGYTFTDLHFHLINGNYPGLTDRSFSISIKPMIGVYVDLIPTKKIRNYAASLELFYHHYKQETDSIKVNSYTSAVAFINYSAIDFNPSIRFLFTKKPARPFIEGNINVSFLTNEEDHYDSYSSGSKTSQPIFAGHGISTSLGVGAGIEVQRIIFQVRYYSSIFHSTTSWSNFFAAFLKLNFAK